MRTALDEMLDEIRGAIAPSDAVLRAARERRDRVLSLARGSPRTLRTYSAGSIAHGTANEDTDADCGVVLDRRVHPDLGPDGKGVGPREVVEQVRSLLREKMGTDEGVGYRLTKRAIKVTFIDEVDGQNPSVDLIVALTRRDAPGLWIPNLKADAWDASDPERHTELFTSGARELRRIRARATRLAKAWNKQWASPAFCSFQLEAFAWHAITESMNLGEALAALFSYGASDLLRHDTPDPAGVSPPIRTLIDRAQAAQRIERAAALMREALGADDADGVRDVLAQLFPDYVTPPGMSASKAEFAARLRRGNEGLTFGAAGLQIGGTGRPLKPTRAYGDGPPT